MASSSSRHHWEFEFHGGGATTPTPTGGTSQLSAVTANDQANDRASSWFFGFGAELMNDVFTAHGVTAGLPSLDPILNAAATGRPGVTVGGRATVTLTRHVALEFSLDVGTSDGLTSAAQSSIESTRAAFAAGLSAVLGAPDGRDVTRDLTSLSTALVANPAVILAPAVTATDAFHRSLTWTPSGAVRVTGPSVASFTPYAVFGGGVSVDAGAPSSLMLTGDYAFQVVLPAGTAPIHETDALSAQWRQGARFVGIVGGGVMRPLTRRTGLRADVRLGWSPSRETVVVNALASSVPGTPPALLDLDFGPGHNFQVPVLANATLSSGTVNVHSTLAGQSALGSSAPIFTASGWQRQVDLTVGYYVRF